MSLGNPRSHELVELVENPNVDLYDRISAAQALARIGDLRIEVFNPKMIEIPQAQVKIGLPYEKLESTWKKIQDTGAEISWIAKEVPQHEVHIKPFRIAKYHITNAEYLVYLEDSAETEIPSSWEEGNFPETKSNHPVYTVSPEAAERYILWLNHKTGRKFRLPTEYEWEYAASGPEELEFPWGKTFSEQKTNTKEAQLNGTTPVGVFVTGNSPFGLSDMAGNVEDYVSDDYVPYPGGNKVSDAFSIEKRSYRMTRGGAFNKRRDLARCKRRHGWYPGHAIGFRLAESMDET
jgi:toxoflavin biosynthesis protein ToxD